MTETNQNIFLTGKAGTGKTTFLRYIREQSVKKSVVAAPTGVAAVNAQGVTLHSLFQLPLGIIQPSSREVLFSKNDFKNHPLLSRIRYSREKLDLLSNVELLIIDEASMLPSYIVDAIDLILRYIKSNYENPFGGTQVLFIGDLNQLPPVIRNEDWEILQEYYSSAFFFDSLVLSDNPPVIIELKNIYRQKDQKFIEILNGIRDNNISEEDFQILSSRLQKNFIPEDDEGYITLTTHNLQADEINKRKLEYLPLKPYTFAAEIINEFPEHILPAEKELKLKRGAQVMFLKNDTEGKQYFNGKIGIVTEVDWDLVKVYCKSDQQEIIVRKSEWQNIRYYIDSDTREIKEEILGTFIQYPLRLAWAITIHKSQGLTFDKVIINAERAFASGQVYVALSRCTSLEGVVLISPLQRRSLGSHSEIKQWSLKNKAENLIQVLAESRENFILQKLKNIFTWDKWYNKLIEMNEFLQVNQSISQSEQLKWFDELIIKQRNLYETAEKFNETLIRLSRGNLDAERNDQLQKRIKDASGYFYNEIFNWRYLFINHPLKFPTKKIAKKADKLLYEIDQILSEILNDILYCKNGFNLKEYLKNKKILNRILAQSDSEIRSSYSKDKASNTDTVKETVRLLKEGKSIEEIAEERNFVISTIEGHIARAIKQGLICIDDVMPIAEAKSIANHFPQNLEDVRLSEIKAHSTPEISYAKLRMVLAWLEKEQK